MTCKCKLPIIRGYEPDCYCLNCGLKLKIKTTMEKKIKGVKLSKDYQTNECFIPKGTPAIINFTGDMFLFKNRGYIKQFTLKEIKPIGELNDVSIFDIEYEEERKKICVEIEYDELINFADLNADNLQKTIEKPYLSSRNIKVTEIKPDEFYKQQFGELFKSSVKIKEENETLKKKLTDLILSKPPEISKEDVKWIVETCGWLSFEHAWAEFQAKKEAENG